MALLPRRRLIFAPSSASPWRRYLAAAAGDARPGGADGFEQDDPIAARRARDDGGDAHNPHCYTVGQFGRIRMDGRSWVPLQEYIRSNPLFESVPTDRLICNPNSMQPLLTCEQSKCWIRSGFIAAHYASSLGWDVTSAFVEGNVGIIPDLNIVAFQELDLKNGKTKTSSNKSTLSVWAQLLLSSIEAVKGASYMRTMPDGFTKLLDCAAAATLHSPQIIYHPDLMTLDTLAEFFVEAYRILRREMPAQGQAYTAHRFLVHIDRLINHYSNVCRYDPMISCWLGPVHKPKSPGLPGVLGISVPPGSPPLHVIVQKITTGQLASPLDSKEWKQLKKLVKKLLTAGGIPTGTASAATSSTTFADPLGNLILKDPPEALLVDVHRHVMVHIVEEDTLEQANKLPPNHQLSFSTSPMGWRDGVRLMLHKCPMYPHFLAATFADFKMWDKLDLDTRFPIPSFFSTPSYDN